MFALVAVILLSVLASAGAVINSVTPSTNDVNRSNGWAHVNQISQGVGTTDLQFVSTRTFYSCFEYRTDGDTSQVKTENGGNNYNTSITDGLYPYTCRNNNSITKTITANGYVEVRMVFGAETDERFNWTRFDVLPPADTTSPVAPTIIAPTTEQAFKTIPILNRWTPVDDVSGIKEYRVEYIYDDSHTFSGGPYRTTTSTSRNHVPNLSEQGGVTIRVQAIDNAGNESPWSNSVHYYYDATAPTAPTVTGFLNPTLPCGAITNIHNTTVDWTDSTDNYALAGYDYAVNYPLAGGSGYGNWNNYLTISQYGGSLNEGVHTVKVRAQDSAGNYSGWSNSCTITADWTAPDVEITNPSSGIVNGTVEVRGTVADNNLWRYYAVVLNSSNQQVAGPGTVYKDDAFTNMSLFTFDTTLLQEGVYTIRLEARDKANNKDAGSTDVVTIIVDHTAPTADLVFANIGPSATSFDVVFSEPVNSAEATNPANYLLNNWPGYGGTGNLVGDADIVYNDTTNTATVTFLNAGWYVSPEQNWEVQDIHDLTGNLLLPNPTSETSTPMVAPVTSAVINGTPGLNGTYVSNVAVDFNATDPAVGSGVKTTYYNLDGDGYLQGNSVLVIADGIHNICYYSTDNAGNTEAEKCDVTFSIDQTAPVIILNGEDTAIFDVGGVYVELGAIADDGSMVVISGSVDTSTSGTYIVSYDATDTAGNVATTVTRTVIVNALPIAPAALTATTVGGVTAATTDTTDTIPPAPTTPTTTATIPDSTTGVAASQTDNDTTEVKGASDTNSGNLWWAWVLAALAVGAGLWFLLARRRASEDS